VLVLLPLRIDMGGSSHKVGLPSPFGWGRSHQSVGSGDPLKLYVVVGGRRLERSPHWGWPSRDASRREDVSSRYFSWHKVAHPLHNSTSTRTSHPQEEAYAMRHNVSCTFLSVVLLGGAFAFMGCIGADSSAPTEETGNPQTASDPAFCQYPMMPNDLSSGFWLEYLPPAFTWSSADVSAYVTSFEFPDDLPKCQVMRKEGANLVIFGADAQSSEKVDLRPCDGLSYEVHAMVPEVIGNEEYVVRGHFKISPPPDERNGRRIFVDVSAPLQYRQKRSHGNDLVPSGLMLKIFETTTEETQQCHQIIGKIHIYTRDGVSP
jgi:hypothetical protein